MANQANITFYTKKPHCPLCDDAKVALDLVCEDHGLTYHEVDIYSDDLLLEKYQLMIPVIEIGDEIVACGKVSYTELLAYFEKR